MILLLLIKLMLAVLLSACVGERSTRRATCYFVDASIQNHHEEEVVQRQQQQQQYQNNNNNHIELDVTGNIVMKSNKVSLDETMMTRENNDTIPLSTNKRPTTTCYRNLLWQLVEQYFPNVNESNNNNVSLPISIILHRNGEADPCTTYQISFNMEDMIKVMIDMYNASDISDNDCHEKEKIILSNKYEMDAFFTKYFSNKLEKSLSSNTTIENNNQNDNGNNDNDHNDHYNNTCGSTEKEYSNFRSSNMNGLYEYCDMGIERSVIHKDHNHLIQISISESQKSLPCRWYTREGLIISSMEQFFTIIRNHNNESSSSSSSPINSTTTTMSNNDMISFHLYAVPAGRVFMFAPKYIGETFILNHIQLPDDDNDNDDNHVTTENNNNNNTNNNTNKIILTVVSIHPRVFDIEYFFSQKETNQIIEDAINQELSTHQFHRSTTGTTGTGSIFNKRTSENAWDTNGNTAMIIKKRCFELLGFDTYNDAYADGLQILRYNQTNAYSSHLDYLEDTSNIEAYNYDTSKNGGNRFATILLYFNDLPEGAGGETVFPRAWAPHILEEDRIETNDMIERLRKDSNGNDAISMLNPGSWEEEMVALCRTKLAIRPVANRAILFYSQYPNGTVDKSSYHGACPVLNGTKLAANLWTWSGIRPEYDGAPLKKTVSDTTANVIQSSTEVKAIFRNDKKDPIYHNAQLFYDNDIFFGNIGINDKPISVNTYIGHIWNVKDKDTQNILITFVVEANKPYQEFMI